MESKIKKNSGLDFVEVAYDFADYFDFVVKVCRSLELYGRIGWIV